LAVGLRVWLCGRTVRCVVRGRGGRCWRLFGGLGPLGTGARGGGEAWRLGRAGVMLASLVRLTLHVVLSPPALFGAHKIHIAGPVVSAGSTPSGGPFGMLRRAAVDLVWRAGSLLVLRGLDVGGRSVCVSPGALVLLQWSSSSRRSFEEHAPHHAHATRAASVILTDARAGAVSAGSGHVRAVLASGARSCL
jgi:hypothetical protein